jgi:putative endonuclease
MVHVKRTIKRKIGDIGESVACRYLEKRGFHVVERNYLKPWGEIDIVAEKGNLLAFVEVKAVTREPLGVVSREMIRPEENMHPAKIERLHRAVQTYLMDRRIPESRPWQIDLACVFLDFNAKRAKVEMFENVIL